MTDPLGNVTHYAYEDDPQSASFGRLIFVTEAAGTADEATRSFEYDAAGNTTASLDELGRRTEYVYNALDQLVEVK